MLRVPPFDWSIAACIYTEFEIANLSRNKWTVMREHKHCCCSAHNAPISLLRVFLYWSTIYGLHTYQVTGISQRYWLGFPKYHRLFWVERRLYFLLPLPSPSVALDHYISLVCARLLPTQVSVQSSWLPPTCMSRRGPMYQCILGQYILGDQVYQQT